ncbi:hypothetical protein QUF76_07395 [Desulfobacterales bacterium HSG16]|nr:hypothetical protein [Desulfobacterales bacterium HSG16]
MRDNGASQFNRLNTAELKYLLRGYFLGELWRKNLIAGCLVYE